MKTTIYIPDGLLEEAKKAAQREGTTLKALVEEGLRKALEERRARGKKAFRLKAASFKGRGLQPHIAGATWDQILDVSYEGRGG